VSEHASITTFLFTDIEGSTRLWEEDPERMRPALARHDAIARSAVEHHHGVLVKMTGDGVHAAFADPLDAVRATLEIQHALADPQQTHGVPLAVRCGLHAGVVERRDNDFYGSAVNRAARIMSAAHGGQALLSRTVAEMIDGRMPEGASLRDLGAVRLRDMARPEQVFQIVHARLRADFPALRSLAETPNNLPHPVTSFIGRERARLEVGALLGRGRLVCLIGMGGLGKTRLSLEIAADALDEYDDGVWLVELAPVHDPRLVPLAVASVLGVKEKAGRPVVEALVSFVKDRKLLLLLDNCEHLLQACAELARQLLQAAPGVRILASSREPLRIAGELTFPVTPLGIPDIRGIGEPGALLQSDAVRLFLDRVAAVQPAFAIDARNAAAISAICHRLDGIPLALELAAPHLRTQSAAKLAERLKDRFRLSMRGDPTTLPRQQTLRMLIDWSYDLLSAPEQGLFRQLAVFAGGWPLDAAEAICACGHEEVIDLLAGLVEKSLVTMEANGERYRLLETVREYAQERLDNSADAQTTRSAHLAYFVDFAERAKDELVGPDQGQWLSYLDAERENILAAHEWACVAQDGAAPGLRLANSVKRYWTNRGLLELGIRVTTEALKAGQTHARDLERCRGLFNAGQLRVLAGQYREARGCLEESLAIARECDNEGSIAVVLQTLGTAAQGEGDLATARRYLEEAVDLTRRGGNKWHIAGALNALGQLHVLNGELDAAKSLFMDVVALAREDDNRETAAIGWLNLAMVAIAGGFDDEARETLLEAFAVADEIRSTRIGQSLLEVTAGLATSLEDWELAARLFGAAECLAGTTGLRRDAADEAFLAPRIARAAAALGEPAFAAAAGMGRQLPLDSAIARARDWLLTCRR
jgi:predicted ATPase/class 3 adenylate cyclase